MVSDSLMSAMAAPTRLHHIRVCLGSGCEELGPAHARRRPPQFSRRLHLLYCHLRVSFRCWPRVAAGNNRRLCCLLGDDNPLGSGGGASSVSVGFDDEIAMVSLIFITSLGFEKTGLCQPFGLGSVVRLLTMRAAFFDAAASRLLHKQLNANAFLPKYQPQTTVTTVETGLQWPT